MWERNVSQLPLILTLTGDKTHNLGLYRDWESNSQSFGCMEEHSNQATPPGQGCAFLPSVSYRSHIPCFPISSIPLPHCTSPPNIHSNISLGCSFTSSNFSNNKTNKNFSFIDLVLKYFIFFAVCLSVAGSAYSNHWKILPESPGLKMRLNFSQMLDGRQSFFFFF